MRLILFFDCLEKLTPIRSGLRERRRPESPQLRGPSVTECWVPEEELELWEIRQFGEKVEKQQQMAKQKAAEAAQRENSEKIRKQMEEQLKKQREALHQKRMAEAAAKAVNTTTISTPTTSKFTSIIQNRGMKRIFTSRGTTPLVTSGSPARAQTPNQFATVRTPGGQTFRIPLSVLQGKSPGQQIVIRSSTTNAASPQTSTTITTLNTQPITRTPGQTATYIVRAPTGQSGIRPIILSNQVRPTLTQGNVQTPTSQPQALFQRQVQVPIRFPDGRMQILQIPMSAMANNQPIQIAINTQPTASGANTLSNSIQIVTSNSNTNTIVSTPQSTQPVTPQIRIITNNSNQSPGQPVVAKLVQLGTQSPQGIQQIRQPSTQTIRIQAPPQQVQILGQQLQSGKIQLKLNSNPTVSSIQTVRTPVPPQQQIVRTSTPVVAMVRIEPKGQQSVTTQALIPSADPSKPTIAVKTTQNSVKTVEKFPNCQTLTQTVSASPLKGPTLTTTQVNQQQFVLTPEITQEIVRQALMNPNVAPEIQQKLMALQRHHQEQKEPVNVKPPTAVTPVLNSRTKSPSRPRSAARNKSRAKQSQMTSEQKEESAIMTVCQAVVKSMLDKIDREDKPKGQARGQSRSANKRQRTKESMSERRYRQNSSKLQVLLFKHTELLKKDISKRRALLEKNLKIEVQNELNTIFNRNNTSVKQINKTSGHSPHISPKRGNPMKRKPINMNNNSMTDEEFDESDEIRPPKQKRSRLNSSPSSGSPKKMRSPGNHPGRGKGGRQMKTGDVYCICKTPYDASRFMVGCDICSNWFHVDCVGLTEVQAKKADQYICPNCDKLKAKNNELYCLCRQPYDESKFYICCDRCQDWFHGTCVGILQSEANSIEEYICPNCKKDSQINFANLRQLNTKDIENLRKLLKAIQVFTLFPNILSKILNKLIIFRPKRVLGLSWNRSALRMFPIITK